MSYPKLLLISVTTLMLYRLFRPKPTVLPPKQPLPTIVDSADTTAAYHALIRNYAELREVRYISVLKKVYFAKDAAGQPAVWDYNFSDSMAALPTEQYFQLSRNCIVHRSFIAEIESSPLDRKLCVVLADPIASRYQLPISKIQAFKLWWYQEGLH